MFFGSANFVYFGMKLLSAKGGREKEIVDYALQVLGEGRFFIPSSSPVQRVARAETAPLKQPLHFS